MPDEKIWPKGDPERRAAVHARPYNLDDEVASHGGGDFCGILAKEDPLSARAAFGLAIARAGSTTLNAHLRQPGVPHYHFHDCSLAAYARAGARRVVVSLRDPVARLVSGFQRRFDDHISQKRPANVLLISTFSMGLDVYVDALLDPAHAAHAAALSCTYGHLIQNYMIPVEEFYLAGMDRAAPGDADVVDVKYACISSLDADIAEAAAAWGVELTEDLRKYVGENRTQAKHHSGNASDSSSTQHLFLSDANAARFRAVYARDFELFTKFCTNRTGGVAGERFAVSSLEAHRQHGGKHLEGKHLNKPHRSTARD